MPRYWPCYIICSILMLKHFVRLLDIDNNFFCDICEIIWKVFIVSILQSAVCVFSNSSGTSSDAACGRPPKEEYKVVVWRPAHNYRGEALYLSSSVSFSIEIIAICNTIIAPILSETCHPSYQSRHARVSPQIMRKLTACFISFHCCDNASPDMKKIMSLFIHNSAL